MLKGHLHSVESLGTVDGPGLRYIIYTRYSSMLVLPQSRYLEN